MRAVRLTRGKQREEVIHTMNDALVIVYARGRTVGSEH
jgi:hypothetical protein